MVDVNISVRSTEGSDDQPYLLWDTQFDPILQQYDWLVCDFGDPVEPQNGGGLQSRLPLDTAIILQLGTNRRAEPGDQLPDGNDPQGWWGDSVQLDDDFGPIGSRLWLLKRAILNDRTANNAKLYAQEALNPLLQQGVFARVDVEVAYNPSQGWLYIDIAGYSKDGAKVYAQRFAPVWALEAAAAARQGAMLL